MLFYTSRGNKSLNPTQNLSQIYLKFYWSWKSHKQLTCHHHEDLPRRKRHTKSFSYEIDLLVTWHFLLKSMNLMINSQIWSRKIPKGGNWDVFFLLFWIFWDLSWNAMRNCLTKSTKIGSKTSLRRIRRFLGNSISKIFHLYQELHFSIPIFYNDITKVIK